MRHKKTAEGIRRRYRRLASRLAATGPIIQGTVTRRVITKGGEEAGERERRYGPYYQWTFKREGKTTTVNLTAKQARFIQRAIENNRKLEDTLAEMRRLSRQLCEASAEGVKRRPRTTPDQTTLS